MDPGRFKDVVWIHDSIRTLTANYFPVEFKQQSDGTSLQYFYDVITLANFVAPLAGLSDETRDALIIQYRKRFEDYIEVQFICLAPVMGLRYSRVFYKKHGYTSILGYSSIWVHIKPATYGTGRYISIYGTISIYGYIYPYTVW